MNDNLTGYPISSFWLWVSHSYATFAIHVEDNKITEAPPIARWCIGSNAHDVIESILKNKNAVIIRMKEDVKEKEN